MLTYIMIIVGLVLLDQITKYFVVVNMTEGQSIEIIPNFFYFTSSRNPGAAWSILENQRGLFIIITVVALAIFGYFLVKEGNFATRKIHTISLLLLIGGTVGNFIDRLRIHHVVDFLDFHILGYDFPIFNFADTFLTIGTIGFMYSILFFTE